MMDFRSFIIHLDRAKSRNGHVEQLRQSLPGGAQVISAVDGRSISADQVSVVYKQRLHAPSYPFALNEGEIAAFLSHRKVWQTIIDDNLDCALIVEDDVQFSPDFDEAFGVCLTHAQQGDFIRFAKSTVEKPSVNILERDKLHLFIPKVVGLGMLAQLVTRDAAKRLLTATEQFDRPVDTFLQMPWLTNVTMKTVHPVLVKDISAQLGGTTVQNKRRRKTNKISRTFKRSLYRWRLSRMSTRRMS